MERTSALFSNPCVPYEGLKVEKGKGGGDQHRGQRRLRQISEQRVEEQQQRDDDAGTDERRQLRLGAGLLDDGGA